MLMAAPTQDRFGLNDDQCLPSRRHHHNSRRKRGRRVPLRL